MKILSKQYNVLPGLASASVVATSSLPVLPPGEEIYDITKPVSMPYPWLEKILVVLAYLIAIWVMYKMLKWLLTPAKRVKKELPPIDPLKAAMRSLIRLQKSPLWENGQVKDVCEQIVFILKSFIKLKYNIGLGAAATTDELLESLRKNIKNKSFISKTKDLLYFCDNIKYAKGELGSTTFSDLIKKTEVLLKWEEHSL